MAGRRPGRADGPCRAGRRRRRRRRGHRERWPTSSRPTASTGIDETAFPNDGWSGATLTALEGPAGRFILKRTSWATDWIARSTRDHALREAVLAADPVPLTDPLALAHLGAAADGTAAAILMPDLSAWLIPWDRADRGPAVVDDEVLDRVLGAAAAIHALPWATLRESTGGR